MLFCCWPPGKAIPGGPVGALLLKGKDWYCCGEAGEAEERPPGLDDAEPPDAAFAVAFAVAAATAAVFFFVVFAAGARPTLASAPAYVAAFGFDFGVGFGFDACFAAAAARADAAAGLDAVAEAPDLGVATGAVFNGATIFN